MAGLEPWHGPPTPIFVCLGSCFTTALTTPPTQPREALLKYAKSGDEDLQWTAGVWPIRFFSQNSRLSDGDGCLFVRVDTVMAILNSA